MLFDLDFTNLKGNGGDTTTPHLSAECQIIVCEVLRPLMPMDTAIFHKATFRLHL